MHRIVIYRTDGLSEDDEILDAVGSTAGIGRTAAAALLATPMPVYLENLEEAAARELFGLLEVRSVDADLEPMAAEDGIALWLRAEIPKWVKRGLLHPASVPRILRNYGLEPPPLARSRPTPPPPSKLGTGTLLRAVLGLGAVLVGLGLILFIAANWQRIPAPVKIGGALLLTLAALHAGYWLAWGARRHPRLGATLFLISAFGIGGVVLLIGQVYHVQADSYLLPLIWGALCVPLALLLRFKPALYVASALWLWAYWLYFDEHSVLPWIYPVLLIGFLVPYGLAVKDRRLHFANLAVLMLALMMTLAAGGFWHCSVLVAALVLLRVKLHQPLYDWLLVAGFLIWSFAFLMEFDGVPNIFYALPLAYFFYRAYERKSNALMIANVLNAQLWLVLLFLETNDRLDLGEVAGTDILLWLLASGLLWFGIGKRLEGGATWRGLSVFLRYAGGMLTALMVYVFSFRFYESESAFYGSRLFLGGTLALTIAGLALAIPPVIARAGEGSRRWGAPVVLGLIAVSLALSFVTPPSWAIHTPIFNLILFVGALAMMFRGHRTQSLGWYNAGILLFVVLIATRYFDTFVEFLPRSVFFVLGGLFLIAWAVLADRQRRRRDA